MKSKEQKAKDNRELRQWYSSRGICPECGRNYKEPGRFGCKACIIRRRRNSKRYDPDGSKQYNLNKARREKRRAEGLCVDCGAPANGYWRCERCRQKQNERQRIYKIKKRLDKEAEEARRNTT